MIRLALFGDPVAHSKSPAMHEAALAALGLAGSYVALRVDEDGLRAGLSQVRGGILDGANITMPFKRLAGELVDRVSSEAERAGSVNTWVRGESGVVGHSTDVSGIRMVWKQKMPPGSEVLILGSGGAAAAALVALEGARVNVSSRRAGAAVALLERVGIDGSVQEWGVPLPGSVVINATPLGMDGESLPSGLIDTASGLLEMAYGQSETPAVSMARRIGIPVADGLDLLAAQGEEAFRLWTGRSAPTGLMDEAARKASRHPGREPSQS